MLREHQKKMSSVSTIVSSPTAAEMKSSHSCEKKSQGVLFGLVAQVELGFGYIWLAVQTLFLVLALLVVQCSTASVIICYLFNGRFMKKRGEFFPRDW